MRKAWKIAVAAVALSAACFFSLRELGLMSLLRVVGLYDPAPALPANFTSVAIPFELVAGHVVLDVDLDGTGPYSFILDSGDRLAIVDSDLAKQLGQKLGVSIEVIGVGGSRKLASIVKDARFTIRGFEGFSQPLTLAYPVNDFSSKFGHKCDGIVGADLIKHFVVEIDYQRRRVTLHNQNTFAYSGPGESVPFQMSEEKHPVIEAFVTPVGGSPIEAKFTIDIGASTGISLHAPFVAKYQLPGSNVATIPAFGITGAGGDSTGVIGRLAEFKIGRFTISHPVTYFSRDQAGAFANGERQGTIGQDVLGKFKLFFDYRNSRIIFEPAPDFDGVLDPAFSGMVVLATGQKFKTFEIEEVQKQSAAAEAGLERNDIISGVDGVDATELTLSDVREMLRRPVSRAVTIHRGSQILTKVIMPREIPYTKESSSARAPRAQ